MRIPLFPLGTVLFPEGRLSLQIFEPRYLDMVGRCWRDALPFGVCLLTLGSEVRLPGSPEESFQPYGTMALIEELSTPHPGLILIRCRGTQRFAVKEKPRRAHGAWTADIDPIPDDPEVPVPEHLRITALGLKQILIDSASKSDPEHGSAPTDWRFADCAWVANRWCELLDLPGALRHQLLSLDNPLIRLELVTDILTQRMQDLS